MKEDRIRKNKYEDEISWKMKREDKNKMKEDRMRQNK